MFLKAGTAINVIATIFSSVFIKYLNTVCLSYQRKEYKPSSLSLISSSACCIFEGYQINTHRALI